MSSLSSLVRSSSMPLSECRELSEASAAIEAMDPDYDDESVDSTFTKDPTNEDDVAASRKEAVPPQTYLDRLKRRGLLIAELRKAYLRDVVMLRHLLEELLTNDERNSLLSQYRKSIPSVDLRQHLMLYSPKEASLDIIPCDTCGGSVEIVHHDSSEIEELSKALSHLDKNKDELRVIIATKTAQMEAIEKRMEEFDRKHKDEKRVLYTQMRELRARDECLVKENSQLQSANQALRADNHEYRTMNRDQMIVRDKLAQFEVENKRLTQELKHAEESQQSIKSQLKFMNEKLNAQTHELETMAKQLTDAKVEIEYGKDSIQRFKANADSFQKRNIKLQSLLEASRKEATKSALQMDLQTNQEQSASEIEGLEAMVDQLREELDVTNCSLRDVQSLLSNTMQDKDDLESRFNDVEVSYRNYKAKTESESEKYKLRLVEATKTAQEFEEKAKKIADELVAAELKAAEAIKTAEAAASAPAPQASSNRRPSIRPLGASRKTLVKEENDKAFIPDPHHKDGRRPGVIIKESRLHNSSRKSLRDSVSESKSEDVETTAEVSIEAPTRRSMRRSAPQSRENTPRTDDGENEDENADIAVDSGSGLEKKKRYKPTERARGRPPRKTQIVRKEDYKSKEEQRSSFRTMTDTTPTSTNDSVTVTNTGVTTVTSADECVSVSGRSTPEVGPTRLRSVSTSKSEAYVSGSDEDRDNIIPSPKIRRTRKTSSKKRYTKLAQLEDIKVEHPRDLIVKSATKLVKNESLASEARVDKKHRVRGGIIRTLSSVDLEKSNSDVHTIELSEAESDCVSVGDTTIATAQVVLSQGSFTECSSSKRADTENQISTTPTNSGESSELTQSLVSKTASVSVDGEESEEEDEVEVELSNDVAKTWGHFTSALNDILAENLGEEIAAKASHVMAPVTIDFCAAMTKCTMGMWKAMRVTKQNADLFCKMQQMFDFIKQYMGFSSDPDDVEDAQRILRNPNKFDKRKGQWVHDYSMNMDLLRELCRDEVDPVSGEVIDSKASNYFGFDPVHRQVKFEIAFGTVLQLKDYNDKIVGEVDSTLQRILSDWADSKLMALDGGVGGSGSEGKLAKVYEELTTTLREKDEADNKISALTLEVENLSQRIDEMAPDSRRAKELFDRNTHLAKNLKETTAALAALDEEHNVLQELHRNLTDVHTSTTHKLQQTSEENDSRQIQIQELNRKLESTVELHTKAADDLALVLERERARLFDLVHTDMQTDPLVEDVSTQTEFLVAPLSLRHKMSSEVPHCRGSSAKRVFFPTVTPGSAGNSTATLCDLFPEYSVSDDTDFNNMVWNSFADGEMNDNSSFRMLYDKSIDSGVQSSRSVRSARRPRHTHEFGLPSVWTDSTQSGPMPARRRLSSAPRARSPPKQCASSPSHSPTDHMWESAASIRAYPRGQQQRSNAVPVPSLSRDQSIDDMLSFHQSKQGLKARGVLQTR